MEIEDILEKLPEHIKNLGMALNYYYKYRIKVLVFIVLTFFTAFLTQILYETQIFFYFSIGLGALCSLVTVNFYSRLKALKKDILNLCRLSLEYLNRLQEISELSEKKDVLNLSRSQKIALEGSIVSLATLITITEIVLHSKNTFLKS